MSTNGEKYKGRLQIIKPTYAEALRARHDDHASVLTRLGFSFEFSQHVQCNFYFDWYFALGSVTFKWRTRVFVFLSRGAVPSCLVVYFCLFYVSS